INRTRAIGHRVRWIRDVTVERFGWRWWRRVEGELPVSLQVESSRGDVTFRRPRVVANPLIGSSPESQRLGLIEISLSLEIVRQEPRQHFPPIVSRGCAAKIDASKFLSFASRPSAVVPRADDEEVLVRRIVSFEQFINL